jgi:hypothetical protein
MFYCKWYYNFILSGFTDLKVGIIDFPIFEKLLVENPEIREFGNMVLKMEL